MIEVNTMNDVKIRLAELLDAEELLKIYAPYVENTAISFEYVPPSVEEFRSRIENIMKRYPYLIAYMLNDKGEENILGYCYCSQFKTRAAYDFSVETTIYLREEAKGQGIGRMLYERLENLLKLQNITNMNACIATIDIEDEHLTNGSSRFHEKMGYKLVGQFNKCGYKFDRWYNMVWMEKMINEHESPAKTFIPFPELGFSEV